MVENNKHSKLYERNWNLFKNICLCLLILILLMGIVVGCGEEIPANINSIMNACGTTREESESINAILEKCEIKNIKSITHDDMLDDMYNEGDTGYRIEAEGLKNIILYLNSNKVVSIIRYAGVDLYSDNIYKEKLTSFYLSSDYKVALKTDCENYVKSILNYPKTAKFPWFDWEYSFNYENKIATVISYVDAKNAFGVESRSYFTFMYKINGNSYSLVYFKFDNDILVDNRE